jgi:hypothetical protein
MSTLKFKFLGIVDLKGNLVWNPGYKELWDMHNRRFIGKELEVVSGPKTRPNSRKQQKYYFAVVVKLIAYEIGEGVDRTEEILDDMFWSEEVDVRGQTARIRISKKTGSMSTVEFEERVQRVRDWAHDFLNVNIPLPGEVEF